MKLGVSLKIDVTNIDKTKLYKGQKGTYLDAKVFIDLNSDQYGNNGMITQELSKADRDAGQQGAILGNCKIFWNDQGQVTQVQQQAPQQAPQQQQVQPQYQNQPNPQAAPQQAPNEFDSQDIPF